MDDLIGKMVEVSWHGVDEGPLRLRLVEASAHRDAVKLVDDGPDAIFGAAGFWIEVASIREMRPYAEPATKSMSPLTDGGVCATA